VARELTAHLFARSKFYSGRNLGPPEQWVHKFQSLWVMDMCVCARACSRSSVLCYFGCNSRPPFKESYREKD